MPDAVIGMTQVFDFTIYSSLHIRASLCFVTPSVSMNFNVIPWVFNEYRGDSIPADKICCDCPVYVNHKTTMVILVN